MPAVIIPVIVTALGFTGVAATIASIGLSLAGSFILSAVAGALAGKPKAPSFDLSNRISGRTEMIRAPIVPRRTVVGSAVVSGPIVYAQSYGTAEGIPNAYLSLIVPLAGHEVDAINNVWLGDTEVQFLEDGVTAGDPFSTRARAGPPDVILNANGVDFVQIYKHLGASGQAADSQLVADSGGKWTADHRLRGIAYLHVRMRFDATIFAAGIPAVRAYVQGKKVLDTRTSTTAFSFNPALQVHDYLTDRLGVAAAEIDTASFNAAANVAEQTVVLKNGGTTNRYIGNGAYDDDERPADVIRDLLSAMAGTLVYSGGLFQVHAGAAAAAVVALTEADLGDLTVHPRASRREIFNAVKAVYVDPARDWQPTDTPLMTSATYEAQDGGRRIAQTVELPFTTVRPMAERLAKIQLERARQQITLECAVNLKGLKLQAWSTCTVTVARLGWAAKKFRVVGWQLLETGFAHLTLREEADAMWAFATAEESDDDPAPDTDLPNPRFVPQPGAFTFSETTALTASGVPLTTIEVAIGAVDTGEFHRYEVQVSIASANFWKPLGAGPGTLYEFIGARDGQAYDFRARAINALGARSAWTTASYTPTGTLGPPDDVTGFRVEARGAEAQLSWDPVADVDLSHYRVKFAPVLSGAAWATGLELVARVARPATTVTVPALIGTYLIKAVDLKGNESATEAAIVTTIGAVAGLNVVETIAEHPTFPGTRTDLVVIDARLRLDDTSLFDSHAGNFDAAGGNFDSGGGTSAFAASGTYEFGPLDLGAVFTSRVTASVGAIATDLTADFDSAAGQFDDREGLFDGSAFEAVGIRLEIATTEDDPFGSPTWSAWRGFVAGDFTARGLKWRLTLTTTDTNATPEVETLSVTVDMPDRIIAGTNVVCPAGGLAVVFSPAAKGPAVPAVAITGRDTRPGDGFEYVVEPTAAGFTLRFKDAAGADVDRRFDYLAKVYGEVAA